MGGREEKGLRRMPASATTRHPLRPHPPGASCQGHECLRAQTPPPAPHPGVGLSSWQRSPLGWPRRGAPRQSSHRNTGCQGSTMPSGERVSLSTILAWNQCEGAPLPTRENRHSGKAVQSGSGRPTPHAHSMCNVTRGRPLSPHAPGSGMSRPAQTCALLGPCPSESPGPPPLFPCASPSVPHPSSVHPCWLPRNVCSSPSLPARSPA